MRVLSYEGGFKSSRIGSTAFRSISLLSRKEQNKIEKLLKKGVVYDSLTVIDLTAVDSRPLSLREKLFVGSLPRRFGNRSYRDQDFVGLIVDVDKRGTPFPGVYGIVRELSEGVFDVVELSPLTFGDLPYGNCYYVASNPFRVSVHSNEPDLDCEVLS